MTFLWLLPLALLPVVFHLFMRVRKQVVLFPSLMFFLQVDPKLSARKRIREWLVLLLRGLAIAFLLFALSRPVWLATGGSGAAAQVILVDNSGSMSGAAPNGRTKLAVALDAVSAMAGDRKESDTMAVMLTVDDPLAAAPEGFVSNREALQSLLGRVKETQASGTPERALAQAISLLSRSSSPRREIHLFTDLQEVEWGGAAHEQWHLPANTRLLIHRIASKPLDGPNVAVAGIAMPNKRLIVGRRYLATVTLNNTSKQEAKIKLDSTDQNGLKSSQSVDVSAHGTREVTVPFETRTPGAGWIGVEIERDAFRQDNQAFATFVSQRKKKVLFLGTAKEFGNLPLAVSPTGDGLLTGLVPVFKGANAGIAADLQADCAMVVARWSGWPGDKDAEDALRAYVEKGGNLLVVPADSGTPRLPAWIPVSPRQTVTSTTGLPLVVTGRKESVWDDLRGSSGDVVLRQLRAFQAQTLSASTNTVALLSLENGSPVLSVATMRTGRVFLSGISFDVTSTTLPVKGSFLALVHSMALAGGDAGAEGRGIMAGGRLPVHEDKKKEASIRTVAGAVIEWKGKAGEMPGLPRSGVYEMEAGNEAFLLAVRSADLEGREAFIGSATVPALAGLTYTVDDYQDAESLLRNLRRSRNGLDMYLPFLLLAMLVVLLEGWLINSSAVNTHCGKLAGLLAAKIPFRRKDTGVADA